MLRTQQRDRIVTVSAYVAGTCVVVGLIGAMALTPESSDEEEQP